MIQIPPEVLASVQATSDRHDAALRAQQEALRERLLKDPPPPPPPCDWKSVLKDATDVTDAVLAAAAQTFDDYFDDGEPIDWNAFFDRLESTHGICVLDLGCGAAHRIQRLVRHRRENQ